MDTLRASNLSNVLSTQKSNSMTLDKDNVSSLVRTFAELSKHEKILFLINIREFTCEAHHVNNCPPTTTTPPSTESQSSQPPDDDSTTTELTVTIATTPTSTPQSLRLSRTSNWLQKTFIQDTQVALPKEEVYSLYKHEFIRVHEKPISTADFGKLMRQVFPDVKARRLGQRGQSKYCYANIRKRSEIEKPALPTPLPQNELLGWAKTKFNIDFGDVAQVVAYLKSENPLQTNSYRKRRASCGGNLLKNNHRKNSTAAARSASVSVLELDNNKDDPLMVLNDTESLEIGSYFENSHVVGLATGTTPTSTSSNWPQLRSLLTDDSVFLHHAAGTTSSLKKKRHSSSVQFEFIKPSDTHTLLHRSQSVPVTEMSFATRSHHASGGNPGVDELQSSSTSSIFDELTAGAENNPLFSSAAAKTHASTSSCSSGSSVMFEAIDVGVVSDVVGSGGVGGLNGIGGVGSNGSDVFFDSVFDLMMSDCQN